MHLLGKDASVPAWIERGTLEQAKSRVRRFARTGAVPHYRLEYLAPPDPHFVRARVLSAGESDIDNPFPGGTAFGSLLEARQRGDYVFLGHEESIWRLDDVRPETSPAGRPYIAVNLVRLREAADFSEREARLRRLLEFMEQGPIRGSLVPYTREQIHERHPR
jgi:hypothetical protein